MSIQLTKIGNSPNIPTKEFVCDTQAEIKNLPNAPMGSTCFCLENKTAWMKGSGTDGEYKGWIQL